MRNLGTVVHRMRRMLLVARIRAAAAVKGSRVVVDIAPDCAIRGRILVRIYPGTTTTVTIGPRCQFGDGVLWVLDGGHLDLEAQVNVRDGVVFHVRGHLRFETQTLISYYSVVHCDEAVTIGYRTALGEHCTVVDSAHRPGPLGDWWVHHVETAPVHIGEKNWIGAKVTVARGVTIGDGCIVAAGAVVTDDVADDTVVGGVPARALPGASWIRAADPSTN